MIPDLERQAVVELRNRGVTALRYLQSRTRERRQALPSQPEPRTAAALQRTNDLETVWLALAAPGRLRQFND